jgi:hypothetical protein
MPGHATSARMPKGSVMMLPSLSRSGCFAWYSIRASCPIPDVWYTLVKGSAVSLSQPTACSVHATRRRLEAWSLSSWGCGGLEVFLRRFSVRSRRRTIFRFSAFRLPVVLCEMKTNCGFGVIWSGGGCLVAVYWAYGFASIISAICCPPSPPSVTVKVLKDGRKHGGQGTQTYCMRQSAS